MPSSLYVAFAEQKGSWPSTGNSHFEEPRSPLVRSRYTSKLRLSLLQVTYFGPKLPLTGSRFNGVLGVEAGTLAHWVISIIRERHSI